MTGHLSPSAQKVQAVLDSYGLTLEVIELTASTRTALEAAQAVGCSVGQIVKSLVFKTRRSSRPILVIASGANRVDEKKLEILLGEPLGKADADFVHQNTGFVIGGVPPVGLATAIITFIDEDLLQHQEIWAAAGTPNAVFRLSPADLRRMTGAQVVNIRLDQPLNERK
jgi:prolyl-tRNA editing enzyme YbaK/EbsC (Cys-tRNA(Pro) deacylase)